MAAARLEANKLTTSWPDLFGPSTFSRASKSRGWP
jgi:hypothetical protein